MQKSFTELTKKHSDLTKEHNDLEMVLMEGQCAFLLEKLVIARVLREIRRYPGQCIATDAIPFQCIVSPSATFDDTVKSSGLQEEQYYAARDAWANLSRRVGWNPTHLAIYHFLKQRRTGPAHPTVDLHKVHSCIPMLHPFPSDCDPEEKENVNSLRRNVSAFISLILRIQELQ